jgi:ASC-1-like (ASCH) protein
MVSNTLSYFLKKSDFNALNILLYDLFHKAYRNKQLKDFLAFDGSIALVIDGTTCFESPIKHFENCTEAKHGDTIYYQYRLLIASAVNIKTHETIVVSIEPILNKDGAEKNDCEMNAAKRLLERLKQYNPKARYTIIADGLYTGAPILKQIKEYKWEAIVSLTDERMDVFKIADCKFGNKSHDFFYTENFENTFLWFEKESLSDFWSSLNIPIYVGKREVFKIKKDGSPDSSKLKLTCFFISTIPLALLSIKKINKAHRARWGIENSTINELKNRYFMKHIFVYRATASVWALASIAMNLFTIFMMRNKITHNFKKMTKEVWRKHISKTLGGLKMFSKFFYLIE